MASAPCAFENVKSSDLDSDQIVVEIGNGTRHCFAEDAFYETPALSRMMVLQGTVVYCRVPKPEPETLNPKPRTLSPKP